jgi:hypothetical protein
MFTATVHIMMKSYRVSWVAHACEVHLGLWSFPACRKFKASLDGFEYLTSRDPADRLAGSEEVQLDVKCDCGNDDCEYDFTQVVEFPPSNAIATHEVEYLKGLVGTLPL